MLIHCYTAFADNAAAFAMRAKLLSPARLQYEKIRHHPSAAAFALVTGLYTSDVQGASVCLLGDA